jgi:hypothetical protein
LSAEQAALKKTKQKYAEALYRKAITLAARTGHLHHAALFFERYAYISFFLLQQKEGPRSDVVDEEAKYRIDEAIRLYQEWGAMAKVELLMKASSASTTHPS